MGAGAGPARLSSVSRSSGNSRNAVPRACICAHGFANSFMDFRCRWGQNGPAGRCRHPVGWVFSTGQTACPNPRAAPRRCSRQPSRAMKTASAHSQTLVTSQRFSRSPTGSPLVARKARVITPAARPSGRCCAQRPWPRTRLHQPSPGAGPATHRYPPRTARCPGWSTPPADAPAPGIRRRWWR